MLEILNLLASEEAPPTKKSAPLMRIANPTSNKVIVKNIGIWGFGKLKDIIFSLTAQKVH
jgi:hypothetical protein